MLTWAATGKITRMNLLALTRTRTRRSATVGSNRSIPSSTVTPQTTFNKNLLEFNKNLLEVPIRSSSSTKGSGSANPLIGQLQQTLSESDVRRNYERRVKQLNDDVPMMVAQANALMDIGFDPGQQAEPAVWRRQQAKDEARKRTPKVILDKIAERQANKYGGGDPTASSLMIKNVQDKGMSAEQASRGVIQSSGRPAEDFSSEFAKLFANSPDAEIREAIEQVKQQK